MRKNNKCWQNFIPHTDVKFGTVNGFNNAELRLNWLSKFVRVSQGLSSLLHPS